MADSDLINALTTANRSSSVLQGIANPPQVNPLAAITAGNQAARAEFATRGMQAQQTLGAILQQSTDANGNVDYQKAHTLAAQAGPIVQMGMAKFAGDASQLRGQQISQAGALHQQVGAWSAALMLNSSDAMLDKIDGEMAAAGYPAGARAEIARLRTLSEPERQQEAYRHNLAQTEALHRMAAGGYPTPSLESYGDVKLPTSVQPPSPWSGGGMKTGPGATIGPPGGSTTEGVTPTDGLGRPLTRSPSGQLIDPDGKIVPQDQVRWPKAAQPTTRIPGINPGGQPYTPPQVGGGGGGSAPSVTIPAQPKGNSSRPALPPPPPFVVPPAPAPGPQGALQTAGGVQVASADPQMAPTTGTPGPPSPAAAGDVAAIQAGRAGAAANPRPPGTQTAADTPYPFLTEPPQGQPGKLESDRKIFTTDQAAFPQVMTQAQNLAHAYDALAMLKSNTGKGAAGLQALRSFAGTLGITSAGTMNEQKLVEVINKYTERAMIDAAGGSATDMGRRMAESSNPGTTLGNAANFELIRNDMGKTMQNAAAYSDWIKSKPGDVGGGYPERRAEIAATTDPRGFVWTMYSPEEQAKINAEVAKNPDAAAKLHRAIGMGNVLKLHPPVTTQPPAPGRQSSLVPPPAPQVNALSMAG